MWVTEREPLAEQLAATGYLHNNGKLAPRLLCVHSCLFGPAAALCSRGAVSVSEVVGSVCLEVLSSSQEDDYMRMCQLGTAVEAKWRTAGLSTSVVARRQDYAVFWI